MIISLLALIKPGIELADNSIEIFFTVLNYGIIVMFNLRTIKNTLPLSRFTNLVILIAEDYGEYSSQNNTIFR